MESGGWFGQLGDPTIAHILTSPYQRCIQTAHPIASALGGLRIKVEDGLGEIQPSFLRGPEERPLDRLVLDIPLVERASYFPLLVPSQAHSTTTLAWLSERKLSKKPPEALS